MRVQIQVKGHLDPSWHSWLEGLLIAHQKDGTSLCSGTLADQAALYGVLLTLRHLGLPTRGGGTAYALDIGWGGDIRYPVPRE